jgi:hypothetical protein
VLDAGEEIQMLVHCEVFDPVAEVLFGDRITIVWTNSSDDAPKVGLSGSRDLFNSRFSDLPLRVVPGHRAASPQEPSDRLQPLIARPAPDELQDARCLSTDPVQMSKVCPRSSVPLMSV